MRLTLLFTLTAAAGTATGIAGAQESRATTEARIRTSPTAIYRLSGDPEHRAALGVGTTTTGTLRDTLGLLITSVTRNSPAEKAGLEEGNRLAAINGVSLRANAADVEDGEMSGALTRRLTRELGKVKPGDDVELRVYRDGRTQSLRVKTADSDSLFRRTDVFRTTREDAENRPTLGFSIGSTGGKRDTLGVLVMSVADSSPASKAGIEEGNRIAAINGVSLRVAREDAGDRWLGSSKAQRLQREIAQLKPGENVTLKVYGNGQFRDLTLKVARAGDLPKGRGGMFYMGDNFMGEFLMPPMTPMTPMPAMPAFPSRPPAVWSAPRAPSGTMHYEMSPDFHDLDAVRMELDRIRPQLDRMRMELPRIIEPARARVRVVNVIV